MKILVVTGQFGGNYPGGIERVSYEVTKRLAKTHDVHVLAHERIKEKGIENDIPITVIKSFNIPKTNFWTFFYIYKKKKYVKSLTKKFKPDIIYSHNPYDTYCSIGSGVPVVSHIHSLYTSYFLNQESKRTILPKSYWNWFWKFRLDIEKKALSNCQYVITYSEFLSKLAEERGAKKITIIPNGIDTKIFFPEGEKINEIKKPAVIFTGRIEKIKGMKYLSEAARKLKDVNFYLIGEKKDIFDFSKNVYLLGRKKPSEIPKFLRSADIFINPVIRDGFEISNIEAMACGLPVITTGAFERSSIYRDVAILIKPNDTDEIVKSIQNLLSDKSLRSKLRTTGIQFSSKYNWDNISSLIEKKLVEASTKSINFTN